MYFLRIVLTNFSFAKKKLKMCPFDSADWYLCHAFVLPFLNSYLLQLVNVGRKKIINLCFTREPIDDEERG